MRHTSCLPASFQDAAHKMSWAFVSGTDTECDTAAQHLTEQLRQLDPELTPYADELLVTLASQAAAAAAARRISAQLATATVTGARPLDGSTEVTTFLLGDGSEIAIVLPTGDSERERVQRAALLAGCCPACEATLSGDWQVHHAESCPAGTAAA